MAKKKSKSPEPETINPGNVAGKLDTARAALEKEKQRKCKRDEFIDTAVNWLKGQQDFTQGDIEAEVGALLKEAYGVARADAAARRDFLQRVKADGRLEIVTIGVDIKLRLNSVPAADPKPETPALHQEPSSEKVETKTIGEHVKDAEGRPTRLPFPHGLGSWVNHKEKGPAIITGMATSGNVTLYGLKTQSGKKIKDVPAFEIQQLDAAVEAGIRDHAKLLQFEKHNAAGREIAEMLAKEQALEVEEAEKLKATRKRIDQLQEKLNKHPYNLVAGDQMQIDMEGDDGTGRMTSPGEQPAAAVSSPAPAAPTTAAERLLGRIAGKDVLELTGENQPWDKLGAASLKAEDSTGKPPKVVPLEIPQAPGAWVCVDIQEGVAIMLQALPEKEWKAKYQERFDAPRALPSNEPTVKQLAGGSKTGFPVKVSRATLYLAPLDDSLLLRLPKAAAQA